MTFEHKAFAERLSEFNTGYCMDVPSMVQTHDFVDNLIHTLFPIKRHCVVDAGEIAIEIDRCAIKLKELLYSIRKSLGSLLPDGYQSLFSHGHIQP